MSEFTHPSQHRMQGGQTLAPFRVTLVLERGDEAAWALPALSRLLHPEGVGVTVIQAMADVSHGGWLQAEPETFWQAISKRRNQVEKQRQRLCARLQGAGFTPVADSVTDTSDEGQEHLLEALHREPPALLVLACRQTAPGEKAPKPGLVSGYITHLASHAPCPTLVLKPPSVTATAPPQGLKILMATDGSEASANAARRLPSLIRCDAAEVTVLHMITPVYLENPVLMPYVNPGAIDEALRQNAEMILTLTQGLLEAQGVPVKQGEVVLGLPPWDLLTEIERLQPDLVVVGTHQRTDRPRWFLGGTSQRLVKEAQASVLVVR